MTVILPGMTADHQRVEVRTNAEHDGLIGKSAEETSRLDGKVSVEWPLVHPYFDTTTHLFVSCLHLSVLI